jgi:hypothetical protein
LRGTFVVGPDRKVSRSPADPKVSRASSKPASKGLPLIEGLVRLLALPAMARAVRASAADTAQRMALGAAAGLAGLVGLFCFTNASLTLLERRMDPAEAWSLVGGFYAVIGGLLYFASTRRRRR